MSEESRGGPGHFAVGSQVADYRLEQQIGHGGMAVVYRARDLRLDRDVALKILAPNLALDDAFRQRFIRESRAAATLDNPNIVPVYEAGESDGVLFIVMRFVRGGDVRSLLDREGMLSPSRATGIVSQVASALDAAHEGGLVHRDVKPANMLLDSGGDRRDHVYLSDFGLSKSSLAGSGLTASGLFLGTLDYTAPEQLLGQKVDGRADQYALACATFELLTGKPPFHREQHMATMYAQVHEVPPLLSEKRPGLADAADEVMDRALAKSPDDRYGSCREFASALRRAFGLGAALHRTFGVGTLSPGTLSPGTLSPGTLSPGTLSPGTQPASAGKDTKLSGPESHPAERHPTAAHGEQAAAIAAVPGTAGAKAAEPTTVDPSPVADPAATDPGSAEAAGTGSADTHPGTADPFRTGPAGEDMPDGRAGEDAPDGPAREDLPDGPAGEDAPDGPAGETGESGGRLAGEDVPDGPAGEDGESGGRLAGPDTANLAAGTLADRESRDGPVRTRRRWLRSPVLAAAASFVIAAGGTIGYFLAAHTNGSTGDHAKGGNSRPHGDSSPGHALGSAPTAPGCTTATTTANQPPPQTVPSTRIKLDGVPLAMQHSFDNHYTFVSLPNAIEVLRNNGPLSLTPLRKLHVPGAGTGLLATPDNRYLIAAAGSGAVILSVANAESGKGNPILGKIDAPHGSGAAITVLSSDSKYMFVTLENSGTVAVFNFAAAISGGLHNPHFIGYIPAGVQPVGLRLAADSNYLYVTSLRHTPGRLPQEGTLSVISVPEAETDPAKSVKTTVAAGCAPMRVYSEQSAVWVTARDSNALLAFDASKLLTDPSHAIKAVVPVGPAPIGLTPLTDARIVVADSNSTHGGHRGGELVIVSNDSALAGRPALLAVIPADGQPFQLSPLKGHNTLLVSDQVTDQLLALSVAAMP